MTTQLQSDLAEYRAELQRRLAVCEAATAEKWKYFSGISGYAHITCGYVLIPLEACLSVKDATFIAESRNHRPGEIRANLMMLDALEECSEWPTIDQRHPSRKAETALLTLIADWRKDGK